MSLARGDARPNWWPTCDEARCDEPVVGNCGGRGWWRLCLRHALEFAEMYEARWVGWASALRALDDERPGQLALVVTDEPLDVNYCVESAAALGAPASQGCP